jgi:hypothetical protein
VYMGMTLIVKQLCTGPKDDIGYGRRSFADDLAELEQQERKRDGGESWRLNRRGTRD